MKLIDLVANLAEDENIRPFQSRAVQNFWDTTITGIAYDSRKVQPGNIFICIHGEQSDGHDYIPQAVKAKAAAIVVESTQKVPTGLLDTFPVFIAPKTYRALAVLSAKYYNFPGKPLFMIGVTGTNGKTTVTHLIQEMLVQANAQKVGLIGTLGTTTGGDNQLSPETPGYNKTNHTTPMALELQQILSQFQHDGIESVVMEVSSHALEQDRTEGCDFDVAVLTNLTQDHLDYHKTMNNYFKAKVKLFQQLSPKTDRPKIAVLNLDDPYALQFKAECPTNVEVITYSIKNNDAMVRAENIQYAVQGAKYRCITPKGTIDIQLKLAGEFGVYNSLAAVAVGVGLNIPIEAIKSSLESVPGVRGRFEVVHQKPAVIVDYAHTPDGLQNVLSAAKTILPATHSRLIAVFGCGGDRDASKRPQMGRIAEDLADYIVVTSDNPRSEDPQQIISDILSGIRSFNPKKVLVEPDRRLAIQRVLNEAQPDDIVVIAGKGHEDYQILNTETIHFDDREEVQSFLQSKLSPAV